MCIAGWKCLGTPSLVKKYPKLVLKNKNKLISGLHEKYLGPFSTIFGDMKAIKPLYILTGLLTLYPPGKK